MRCPHCQHENRESAKFCEECGARLALVCPSCRTPLRVRAKFCDHCGTRITGAAEGREVTAEGHPFAPPLRTPAQYTPAHLAARIVAEHAAMVARGAPDGERKTITALFADITGSTALIEELDPEAARAIVDPVLQLLMAAVHRYEGYVAQSLGDGIFALFGAPIAHEDHAQRAVYAALRMQEEVKRYADRLRLEKGVPLQIRVGVNSGEVVVRSIRTDDLHTDYVPVGHSINLAARMESLATPGTVVVSAHTRQLVEGYVDCKPLGAAQIKGVSEPVPIYEVTGIGRARTRLQVAARRGLSPFVGRQDELAQLQRLLQQAEAGRGQLVGVVGEPGVGKSRLCHELKLLAGHPWLVLHGVAAAHDTAIPYGPVIEVLTEYFHIAPRDDARRRREKLTGRVLTLDRTLEDTLPYLLALVSPGDEGPALQEMEPQIRSRRLREAVRKVLLRESVNQPVLLLFEDLQWVDSETQAFLDLFSESLATARVLLVVNYRPGYHHGWGNHAPYSRMRLAPFGPEDAHALLRALLGESAALQPVRQFVLEKAEGNPLFLEEIVRALMEQGVLAVNGGVPTLLKPLAEVQLPPTIHGILAARIDRLGTEEKALLQAAAVIGKQFPVRLLERVAEKPEEAVLVLLARLRAGEFVYEHVAFPESAYAFKHALIQEVAYHSLLLEQRQRLHERTAEAIEGDCCREGEGAAQTVEEQCGELAYHYSRSGNIPKAVEYLERAGEQAISRAARAEALQHFSRALELVRTLPDSAGRTVEELRLLAACGGVRVTMEGYRHPEVERIFTQVRELSQQGADTPHLLPVLMVLSRFALVRGEYQDALQLGEWFARLARRTQDEAALLPAHFVLGYSEFRVGRFTAARHHLEQGLALRAAWQRPPSLLERLLYQLAASGQDPRVGCLSWSGWVLWHLGYPDQALVRSQAAVALARELALPASEAAARYFAAAVHRFRGESPAVLEGATAVLAIAEERESPDWLASGRFLRGWALADLGQWNEGIAHMRHGIEGWQALGNDHLGQPTMVLADTYGKAGRAEEGLHLLASVIPLIEQSAERWWEAERYRVEGELILQQSTVRGSHAAPPHAPPLDSQSLAKAEACLLQAIDVARQQQAKSLELRATMSLARLRQRQGKKDTARQMLGEIYGWFTEGFDTKDLQEAKALLETLA